MTYCVGIYIADGLVFAADTRTNAGVDHLSTFRKLHVFERPGDRVMVLLSAGNLATSQAVVNSLTRAQDNADSEINLFNATDMFSAAEIVGRVLRDVLEIHGDHVKSQNAAPEADFLFGGQISGGRNRLYHIYSAGNFIEATPDTPFFQIGEVKYGKPILDRTVRHAMPLELAAKAALLSFDATLRSNASVGLPVDLVTYRKDQLKIAGRLEITESDQYFTYLRRAYSDGINALFDRLPEPGGLG